MEKPNRKVWRTPKVSRYGAFADATRVSVVNCKGPGTADAPSLTNVIVCASL